MTVTLEWVRLENQERFKTICMNGVPIYYPTEWLQEHFLNSDSPKTARTYAERLLVFYKWLHQQKVDLFRVNMSHMAQYQSALMLDSDHPNYLFSKSVVSDETQYQTIRCAYQFLEWLADFNSDGPMVNSQPRAHSGHTRRIVPHIARAQLKPLRKRVLKRRRQKLPKLIADHDIEAIRSWINARWEGNPDIKIRNRAIFELLIQTGIRIGELVTIRLQDVDYDAEIITLHYDEAEYQAARRAGKKGAFLKTGERVVKLPPTALQFVNEYITLYRPREAFKFNHERLFCTHKPPKRGCPMTLHAIDYLFRLISSPISEGGCGVHVHPHRARHTYATAARKNGASLRAVQQQLGHKDAKTTEIYDGLLPELRRPLLDSLKPPQNDW